MVMKRLRYICLSCIAAAWQAAGAQTEPKASLQWLDDGRLQVEWTEPAAEGLKSEYSRHLTPMLCNGTDTMRLAPLTVRGRLNRKRLRRAMRLNGGEADAASLWAGEFGKGDTIRLRRAIEPAAWMKHGIVSFCIGEQSEGCCHVTDLPVRCMADAVYIPPFVPALTPIEEKGRAGELEKRYPIVRPISDYKPDHPRSPMYINFPLDRHEVFRDFHENARRLDLIVDMTREIMADTISRVCLIQVVGKASPEGPVQRNIELAGARAEALKRYVQERVDVPDTLFETINGGEAWDEFRSAVEASDVQARQEILGIIDGTDDVNLREKRIKEIGGGVPYKELLSRILKEQRYSGYMQIYYDYKPDTVPPIVNRAIGMMRKGDGKGALQTLGSVKHDKRAYNAYGAALYMNGRKAEAESYLRRAAADGNEDARRNMEMIRAIAAQEAFLP